MIRTLWCGAVSSRPGLISFLIFEILLKKDLDDFHTSLTIENGLKSFGKFGDIETFSVTVHGK